MGKSTQLDIFLRWNFDWDDVEVDVEVDDLPLEDCQCGWGQCQQKFPQCHLSSEKQRIKWEIWKGNIINLWDRRGSPPVTFGAQIYQVVKNTKNWTLDTWNIDINIPICLLIFKGNSISMALFEADFRRQGKKLTEAKQKMLRTLKNWFWKLLFSDKKCPTKGSSLIILCCPIPWIWLLPKIRAIWNGFLGIVTL